MRITNHPHQRFISGSPDDLAQELGHDGIMTILGIIYEAYENVRAYERVTSETNFTFL
jgi:hypothetical protein